MLPSPRFSIKICNVALMLLSRQSFGPKFCVVWRGRCLLQDEDHSGSRPHSFPGFPRLCSGMFPERFRNAYVSVGSREIRPT